MARRIRDGVRLLLLLSSWAVLAGFVGSRIGRVHERNLALDTLQSYRNRPASEQLLVSVQEVVGIVKYHSAFEQDKWVAQSIFPKVGDGFFVDVGSADGVKESNTKTLEDRGWRGVCVDPFPTNMETRTCTVFTDVVSSEPGRTVRFQKAGFLSGMVDHLGSTKNWVRDPEIVELTTTTLAEILRRANAPRLIHYMSLDIEGAELEALRGFPFAEHDLGSLTVEHNWEEPKRTLIRRLLEDHGYRYALTLERDDCYLPRKTLPRPQAPP